jgi:DNA-binding SARP family transcriptional activator
MTGRFGLLGAVEATIDNHPIALGHTQLRCMLALLLIEANHPVTVDQFIDRVWADGRLPRQPRRAVQHNIPLLRRALAPAPGVSIARAGAGYQLSTDPDTIDLHRFHALLAQARATQDGRADIHDADQRAAALLEEALALWRGEPLADLDVDTAWLHALRVTLTRHHEAARLDLTDIRLRQGRHTTLLAELAEQTTRHPFDERLAGQYLLALYRSGRQAEALRHYRDLQHVLAEELGTVPSRPLQQLHQQILTADPALSTPTPAPQPVPTARQTPVTLPVPRRLPAPPPLFTGRATELAALDTVFDTPSDAGGTVVISAIGGPGGIGKTALALHWAHQHLHRFPDGQLYVNLRGFDPSGRPTPTGTAIRGFLDGLGVDPATLPVDLDAQVARYRSLVAGKRMLIVLDNARDIDQVIPLLPDTPTCTVLVTSRRHMPGLAALYGAHLLDLDVLLEPDARELLARHLGRQRLAAEPAAVADPLTVCAGLPLAVVIVAARAQYHHAFPLAVLAEELRDASSRLDGLDAGDLRVNLRAVLSWSIRTLSPQAANLFALLGIAPGPAISLPAATSLAGQPAVPVRMMLRELEHASLVTQYAPSHYRMHDLIRLYATDAAHHDLTQDIRDAALRRVLDTHTAGCLLNRHRVPALGVHPPLLPDIQLVLALLETEHATLLAAQRAWHPVVCQLAWPLTRTCLSGGRRGWHPFAPTEPYVSLSASTALVIRLAPYA